MAIFYVRKNVWTICTIVVMGILIRSVLRNETFVPRNQISEHLLNHRVLVKRNLISDEYGKELLDLVKTIGSVDGYPTNAADTNFYHTEHEHIGEAIPARLEENGTVVVCDHPLLIPSRDRSQCVLPGRLDIAKHFFSTGGALGLRESYKTLISRIQSFGAYHFDLDRYPVVTRLFNEKSFLAAAKEVCPVTKRVLDPFQFNFIIQLPGQTVPIHVDGVYFKTASRFQFPQWLLAAMQFSGLFQSDFVHQVQVVGYLHTWSPTHDDDNVTDNMLSVSNDNFGSFLYWNSPGSRPTRVLPYPLSGSIVDGSKVVHAASVYRKDTDIPYIKKSVPHWLKRIEENRWILMNEQEGTLQTYELSDLRISIVYRARCFASQEEISEFRSKLQGPDGVDGRVGLDDVLRTFVDDLKRRGKLSASVRLETVDRLDLALAIVDEYIKYPLPHEPAVPWNYCAVEHFLPEWAKRPLSLLCG